MKIILIFALAIISLNAQHRDSRDRREFGKRFDDLEKLKLLDILDMDEETAIKFFSRRNEMKKNVKVIIAKGEGNLDIMEKTLKSGDNTKDLDSLIKESLKIEEDIFKERAKFISSVSEILDSEQIAKLILFEKKFKRDVKDLLIERGRKKFFNKDNKN